MMFMRCILMTSQTCRLKSIDLLTGGAQLPPPPGDAGVLDQLSGSHLLGPIKIGHFDYPFDGLARSRAHDIAGQLQIAAQKCTQIQHPL